MSDLTECRTWLNEIEWDLIHEDAVTRYLEWGNNNFNDALRRPVVGSGEYAVYFVVDTWNEQPKVVLMKMDNYGSEVLCEKELPQELRQEFYEERGKMRGIFEPTDTIREWLRKEMGAS